jgi:hypothetical protein
VQLISSNEITSCLKSNKTIITILDATKVFNSKYLPSLKKKDLPSLNSPLKVCLNYGPLSLTDFYIFPNNFYITNKNNTQINACADYPDISKLKDLGIISTLPNLSLNQKYFFTIN